MTGGHHHRLHDFAVHMGKSHGEFCAQAANHAIGPRIVRKSHDELRSTELIYLALAERTTMLYLSLTLPMLVTEAFRLLTEPDCPERCHPGEVRADCAVSESGISRHVHTQDPASESPSLPPPPLSSPFTPALF